MNRVLVLICMAVVCCGICQAATFSQQGLATSPNTEFMTLSDMASMPIAATAGDVITPVQEAAALQETLVAIPTAPLVEGGTNLLDAPLTNVVVVLESETGSLAVVTQEVEFVEGTNVVASLDKSTELVPANSFPGASEKQNLISVSLDDVPLQDVVRLFTRISGANIISSSTNLQGKVTVNLQDVEWKPALDSILDMYSLMVAEKVPGSGIFSIMTKVPGVEPLIAHPIFLDHAQVSNVVAVLLPMVGKGGTVSPFPNANAIVVRANAADLNAIIKVVSEIDVPRQQVYIEAKFLELTDEAIKDLGVNWQVLEGYGVGIGGMSRTINDEQTKVNTKNMSSDQADIRQSSDSLVSGNSVSLSDGSVGGVSSVTALNNGRDTTDSIDKSAEYRRSLTKNRDQTISDIRTAVLSADDFRLVLSALQQINGITVISNPKIIVANQETATIHIGENQPNIKGTVTAGQQGQANTTTYALDTVKPYFEFGVSLDVTPTINNQSNITVRILPTLSRYIKDLEAPDGTKYPIEATKKIKTVFSLDSGKTAAIGGLTETDERESVIKIPVLGDIPIIGKYLFSYTHKKHTQTETIIFVTVGLANPKTLMKDEGLPEETELTQKHIQVSKKLKDQKAADALKLAEIEKAAEARKTADAEKRAKKMAEKNQTTPAELTP